MTNPLNKRAGEVAEPKRRYDDLSAAIISRRYVYFTTWYTVIPAKTEFITALKARL
jgi:hypothetical protein